MNDAESNALLRNSKQAWSRTQAVLREKFGVKYTLQFMSLKDRQRLTVLLVWEQRYKVPLEWIVEWLLFYYTYIRKSKVTGRRFRNPGLPVRVVTFVSQNSKEVVEREIANQFPNGDHIEMWKYRQQMVLMAQLRHEEGHGRDDVREFVRFPSLRQFVKDYGISIQEHRRALEKLVSERRRRGKPYRNSPCH